MAEIFNSVKEYEASLKAKEKKPEPKKVVAKKKEK